MLKSAVLATLILVARAQFNTTGLPLCGLQCVNNGIEEQTECDDDDYVCMCSDQLLGYNIGLCLGSTCNVSDMNTSLTWLQSSCLSSTVASGLPTLGSTATGSAATATDTNALFAGSQSGSSASSSSGSSSSSNSTSPSGSPQSQDGGLSTGAQAGIGVGISLLGIGIIAGALFFWLRRRKSKKAEASDAVVASQAMPPGGPGEIDKNFHQANSQGYYSPQQQGYGSPQMQHNPTQMPMYAHNAPPYDQATPVSSQGTYTQPYTPYGAPSPMHSYHSPTQPGAQSPPTQPIFEAPEQGNVHEAPANPVAAR